MTAEELAILASSAVLGYQSRPWGSKGKLKAVMAIARGLCRRGDTDAAGRIFVIWSGELIRGFGSNADEWWMLREVDGPFDLLLSTRAECGDVEGAFATLNAFPTSQTRCHGLVCVGVGQARAGDAEGAWQTFLRAVEVSGGGDGGTTTSLGDIAEAEIRLGDLAAARVIVDRLGEGWLRRELQSRIEERANRPQGIPDWEDFQEFDMPPLRTNEVKNAEARQLHQLQRIWKVWEKSRDLPAWQFRKRASAHQDVITRLNRTKVRAQGIESDDTRAYVLGQVSLFFVEIGDIEQAVETALTIPGEADYYVFERIVELHTASGHPAAARQAVLRMRDCEVKVRLLADLAQEALGRSDRDEGQALFREARKAASTLPKETWHLDTLSDLVIQLADAGFVEEAMEAYSDLLISGWATDSDE